MEAAALTSPPLQETRRKEPHRVFPPFVATSLCGAFIVAGLGVWFIAAALRLKEDPMVSPAKKSVRCLTSALTEVANYIDTESDPCTDFHEFACNKSGYTPASTAIRLKFANDIINPVLQGRFKDHQSQLLSVHYSSCVETAATGQVNIEEATRSMMKMFRSKFDLHTHSGVVKLIGMLSIQLGLYMPVYTYAALDDESGYAYMGIAASIPLSTPRFFTDGRFKDVVQRFLNDLQSQIIENFTVESLREFHDLAKSLVDEDDRIILKGNLSVLNAVSPAVSLNLWEPYLVEAFHSWTANIQAESEHINVKVVGPTKISKLLGLYAAPEQRFQAVAYLAFWSVYQFFWEDVQLDANAKTAAERAAMCLKMISSYRFVWASIAVDKIKQPQHDALIVDLYRSVVESASKETETVVNIAQSRNLSLLDYQGMMSALQLVLPGDVTSGYPQRLPRLTRDYWTNALFMRRLQRTAAMTDSARGFSGMYSTQFDMFANPVIFYKKKVVFSPTVYSMLNSDCQDQRERRLLDALFLGVTVADQLFVWLSNRIWSSRSRGDLVVRKWLLCHQQPADASHIRDSMIVYPWLALRVAQRMAHLDWWDNVFIHWTTWMVQPAQIFYGLFYTRHMCGRVTDTAVLNTTSLRMHAIPGFSVAFQCPPRATSSPDLCIAPR